MIPNLAIAIGSKGASLRTVRYSISARSYCSAWKSRLALARYRFIRACLEQPAPEMATRHTISIPKRAHLSSTARENADGNGARAVAARSLVDSAADVELVAGAPSQP